MTNEAARQCLKNIAAGKAGELELFVGAISGRVVFLAEEILHDGFAADDVLSHVIEQVWRKARLLAGMKKPLGYINTIAYNFSIDLLRKRRELSLNEKLAADSFAAESEQRADVVRALENLDEEEREILLYVAAAGYSLSECARLTGMTKKMCFTRYRRAKEKFRQFYGEA